MYVLKEGCGLTVSSYAASCLAIPMQFYNYYIFVVLVLISFTVVVSCNEEFIRDA